MKTADSSKSWRQSHAPLNMFTYCSGGARGIIYLTPHIPTYSSAPADGEKPDAGAPVIAISPDMIRAGVRVLKRCGADDDLELIAVTTYEAMARAID